MKRISTSFLIPAILNLKNNPPEGWQLSQLSEHTWFIRDEKSGRFDWVKITFKDEVLDYVFYRVSAFDSNVNVFWLGIWISWKDNKAEVTAPIAITRRDTLLENYRLLDTHTGDYLEEITRSERWALLRHHQIVEAEKHGSSGIRAGGILLKRPKTSPSAILYSWSRMTSWSNSYNILSCICANLGRTIKDFFPSRGYSYPLTRGGLISVMMWSPTSTLGNCI